MYLPASNNHYFWLAVGSTIFPKLCPTGDYPPGIWDNYEACTLLYRLYRPQYSNWRDLIISEPTWYSLISNDIKLASVRPWTWVGPSPSHKENKWVNVQNCIQNSAPVAGIANEIAPPPEKAFLDPEIVWNNAFYLVQNLLLPLYKLYRSSGPWGWFQLVEQMSTESVSKVRNNFPWTWDCFQPGKETESSDLPYLCGDFFSWSDVENVSQLGALLCIHLELGSPVYRIQNTRSNSRKRLILSGNLCSLSPA